MSNPRSHINSRSNSTSPFAIRNNSIRPSVQESSPYFQPPVLKNNYGDYTQKLKTYGQTIKDPTPPKNTREFGRTFYPKSKNNMINDSSNNPFHYEEVLNSTFYNPENHRNRTPNQESINTRDNKFKTLNARADYNTIYQNDERNKNSKMLTISPGEYTGKDLKAKVAEQIKKNFKRNDINLKVSNPIVSKSNKNEKNAISRNRSKENNEQITFPVIGQSKKNIQEFSHDRMILVENVFPVNQIGKSMYKELDDSFIRIDDDRRTKSSIRHASVLRSRVPVEANRRAVSNQKSSNHRLEDQRVIKLKNLAEEFPEYHPNPPMDVNKEQHSAIISLGANGGQKIYLPRPPSGDKNQKPRSRSSSNRPNLKGHLKERVTNKLSHNADRLNNSDIIGIIQRRDSPVPKGTLLTTEMTNPNMTTDHSYYATEERDFTKGIAHYKTQPILEERDNQVLHHMQNNKSIDDGLRKTVDSQHEISYCDKNRNSENGHPIEVSSNFVVSPPCDYKRGKFIRKLKDTNNCIKREESSKNLLDELAEEDEKVSSKEKPLAAPKKREVSKSPFDDLLETSLRSYEKDSIVRSRTRKEIEMTVSMTKNPVFKRSKVIVSKGYNGSTEGHMASTNVTNSKSTYRNESIQSNLRDELFSVDPRTSKKDLDIDFGFEDDLSLTKKKSSNEPKQFNPPYPTKKSALQLNVIAEETNQNNQKETILMSEDVINSEEFQRIVAEDDNQTMNSPSSKKSTIKPLYFNCGSKLHKAGTSEKKALLSEKLLDDDICVNGENSDCDVVNSRIGLDASYEFGSSKNDRETNDLTITHSKRKM